jgi:hypothetical protein
VDLLAAIAAERRGIADLVQSLSPEQLDTPSLCGDWTVRDVAGHLLAAVDAPAVGLRFTAADLDWAWGTGPAVTGAAEAVMMAMTGRPVALDDLDGPGVPVLRDRLRA